VRLSRVALGVALLAAALGAARLAPSTYAANALVTLALYVVLALAFDLMAGHIGAVSLAAPAFYAIGAYTAGILATRYEAGLLVTLPAAVALAALVAVAAGWPLFRLSDLAFAIGSLGLGLIAAALANNLIDLTGGPMCTTGVAPARVALGPLVLSTATPRAAYVLAVLLAAVALLTYLALTTYRAGRTIAMIQGDEQLAAALGVNPLRHKLTLFAASGALTAAAGVFYAHYTTVVCPADFSPFLTINQFVGETHHRQHDGIANHLDGGQVERVAQDELGDADAPGFAHRLAKQRIGAVAALRRRQIIRCLEEAVVDFLGLDEIQNIDGSGFLDRSGFEVFLGQYHEVTLGIFEALHEVFPRDRLAFTSAHPGELNRRFVRRVEHAETRPVVANRGV